MIDYHFHRAVGLILYLFDNVLCEHSRFNHVSTVEACSFVLSYIAHHPMCYLKNWRHVRSYVLVFPMILPMEPQKKKRKRI
jgi:uncharacterized MAPEG superfamily protein